MPSAGMAFIAFRVQIPEHLPELIRIGQELPIGIERAAYGDALARLSSPELRASVAVSSARRLRSTRARRAGVGFA